MDEKRFSIATELDRKKYVVRPYEQLPQTELVEGSFSHLVNTEKLTISFLTMKAHSYFEIHTHENEQFMIVVDGYCDEIIDGKIYRVEKGDAILLPPNVPHGAFIRDVDCKAIDIFAPARSDYMTKYRNQNPEAEIIFIKGE